MTHPESTTTLTAAQLAAWADELRAMAGLGLLYTTDAFDRGRYTRLQRIAAEMLAATTTLGPEAVLEQLAPEVGYITPKVGVAAAVFDARGRLLLIRRRDTGLWAMPGGWADVGETPAQVTAREVLEETGLTVRVERLLGVYDTHQRGFRNPHQIYHLVFICAHLGGSPVVTEETLGVDWYAPSNLPLLSPGHQDPVSDAFLAYRDASLPPIFD